MEPTTTGSPYLLVEAEIDPDHLDAFERWHRETHVDHVLKIPGVVAYRRFRSAQPNKITVLYEIADDEKVNAVLRSDEANRAREEWAPWMPHVRSLTVEVYSVLTPSPLRRHRN